MFSNFGRVLISIRPAVRTFSSVCYGREQTILYKRPIFGVMGEIMARASKQSPYMAPGINTGVTQVRWATRGGHRGNNLGNTYQPNTLRRKRRLGFLARMKSISGRKIVKNRKQKGRWFLTY